MRTTRSILLAATISVAAISSVNAGTDGTNSSPQTQDASISKFFTGGFLVSSTFNSKRVSSIKYVARDDGGVFAQVSSNPSVQYGAALTFGFLSPNFNVNLSGKTEWWSYPQGLLFCGPFAFLPRDLMPNDSTGCGPILVGTLTSGSSNAIAQVGAGWAVDAWRVGSGKDQKKIAVSFGILVNPNDTVLDEHVIDPHTMLVKSDYLTAAKAGSLAGTTNKTTAGVFGMISIEL